MNPAKVQKFEELLSPYLGKYRKILNYDVQRLTAPGENYGSSIWAFNVVLFNDKTQKEETLHLVGKMLPPNELLREIFNVQVSVKRELGFYADILPALREFLLENDLNDKLDFFPEFYNGRISLDESDVVTSDAIILIENLKTNGYVVVDRLKGFDLETTRNILKNLAIFHAVPLAYKIKRPQRFAKFQKYFQPMKHTVLSNKQKQNFIESNLKIVDENSSCKRYSDRVKQVLEASHLRAVGKREPFATIVHNDFWVNNTMIKFENNKPVANKMVDFQGYEYGSPAMDILFFLFSSTENYVIENYYDELIQLYWETFSSMLSHLNCDIPLLDFKSFLTELDLEARNSQFIHLIFMLKFILSERGTVKELSELTEDDLSDFTYDQATQQQKEKVWLVVSEFAKRNWI